MENKNKRNNSSNKKKHKKVLIISSIFVLLALVSAAVGGYLFLQLDKMKTAELSKSNDDLGINNEALEKIQQEDPNKDVINIALFGVDRRSSTGAGRSDSIMIASIDKKHKKIKLSSVMRDTYVAIPGRNNEKITHAYAYGGAQLAIKTLNENFQLNIKDYVTVDFFSLEKIIDALGGVTINVQKNEINLINSYMTEVAAIENKTPRNVTQAGTQTLNGMQAVAYSRIRYVGNGDYERTERQRTVLTALFNKIQSAGITKYPSIVATLLPYTETSISKADILAMGTEVLTSGIKTLDQERFPVDGYAKGQTINGASVIVTDLKVTTDQMHKYIYEDIKPTPKK
ncbi:LCP family protein [Clostridium sp. SYSU_GA19001]|uniref:LCP family protein n=1 Tax=Clostridium caldaquaticum TaxID=2940653 RepID=UPI0020779197|nr:LCP family protein [Clostridium caldaquaticum]